MQFYRSMAKKSATQRQYMAGTTPRVKRPTAKYGRRFVLRPIAGTQFMFSKATNCSWRFIMIWECILRKCFCGLRYLVLILTKFQT
jgi:hypothetical protein